MILPVLFFVCLFDFYLKHLQIFPKGFLIYIFCFIRTKNNSCKLFYCEGYKNFCEPKFEKQERNFKGKRFCFCECLL